MVDSMHMFEFNSNEIKSVNVYKSSDYNYATVYLKKGTSYISINYEWQGDITPDFVMDIVSYFGTNKITASIKDPELIEFNKRLIDSK